MTPPTRDAPSSRPPASQITIPHPAAAFWPALTPPHSTSHSVLASPRVEVYHSLLTPNHAHATTEEVTFQILTRPLPVRVQRGEALTAPPIAKPRRHEGDLPLGLHAPGGATTGSHVVSLESEAPPRHARPAVLSVTPLGRLRPGRGEAPGRPHWTGWARWARSRTRPGCKNCTRWLRSRLPAALPLGALRSALGPPD